MFMHVCFNLIALRSVLRGSLYAPSHQAKIAAPDHQRSVIYTCYMRRKIYSHSHSKLFCEIANL